jgi:hypothetical protein
LSWLFEDPTTLIVAGVLIEVLLAVVLYNTGRGAVVGAMVAVLVVVGLGVLIERIVVTDREQVADTLAGVASAAQANDVEEVLSFIDPASTGMRASVRMALGSARISEVRIYDLVVEVNEESNPPKAQAEFTGRVKGHYRGEAGSGEGMLLRKFTVNFRRQGDRWLMTDYEDRGPLGRDRED